MPDASKRRLAVVMALAAALLATTAGAHPQDEFCVPGDDGLDPALCEALSALDSETAPPRPILDDAGEVRGFWSTAGLYATIGVRHILPDGLDHILFVLALFLSSTRLRALVIQISTFTVAHTVTLGLVAAGAWSPPTALAEPLIAATIAFVAIENLFLTDMPRWRPAIVLVFGLVHGLGFAGFFGELGLPAGQFWSALIGFNVGVEIGQLGVVLAAFLLARGARRRLDLQDAAWRRYVVLPCSALTGLAGVVWTIERTLGQFA